MSYQYRIVSDFDPPELFKKVISGVHSSSDYVNTFLNAESAGFKYKNSESSWNSDIELYFNSDGLFLDVHAGNAQKLLALIDNYLREINMLIEVEFEEL